jgi:hypothetical protein
MADTMALEKKSLIERCRSRARQFLVDMLWNGVATLASTVIAVLYVGFRYGWSFPDFIVHAKDFWICAGLMVYAYFIIRLWKEKSPEWREDWRNLRNQWRNVGKGGGHD